MLAVDSSKTFFRTYLVGRQHCTLDLRKMILLISNQTSRTYVLNYCQGAKVTIPLNSFMFRRQILIGQSLSEPLKQQRTKNTFWGRCGGLCVISQNHGWFWHKLNTNGLINKRYSIWKNTSLKSLQYFLFWSVQCRMLWLIAAVLGLAKCLYHSVCSM